jgi:hypothetical protein
MGKNRDLPTYEPQVRLEVTPNVDVQSPAQSLINAFSHFAGAVNTAEVMFTKYEVENQRADIRNQVAKDYQEFSMNAMQQDNKAAALDGYNEQSERYAKEYLDQTHFWNRAYAKNMVDYFSNVHRDPIIKAANLQTNKIAAGQKSLANQDMTTQIFDSIDNSKFQVDPKTGKNIQFDQADALIADQFKNLTRDWINGYTSENVIKNTIPTLNKQYTTRKAVKGYQDALEQGKGFEYLQEFRNTPLAGFTNEEKETIINGSFSKTRDQYFTKLGITTSSLDHQMNEMLSDVENGATPNTLMIDYVHQSKSEPEYVDFQNRLEIAKTVSQVRNKFSMMNPLQAQNELEQYRPRDPKDPNFHYQMLLYNKLNANVQKSFDDFYKDPVTVARQDPTIQEVAANYKVANDAGVASTSYPNSPFNTKSVHPDYSLAYTLERRGLTLGGSVVGGKDTSIRFMSDAEAKTMVPTLLRATPRQVSQIFDSLRKQSANTSFFNARVQQLVRAGLPPQYATVANIDPTSPYVDKYMEAIKIPLDGKDGLNTQMGDVFTKVRKDQFDDMASADVYNTKSLSVMYINSDRKKFKAYMGSTKAYGGDNPVFKHQMLDTIKNFGYYALLNNIVSNPSDAVNWGEKAIVDKYTMTTIHGQDIRVPKEYNAAVISAYAESMEEKVKDIPFLKSGPTVNIPSRAAASNIDENDLILKGHWANDPIDSGLVWVDKLGHVRVDKNGHPFKINFSDAQKWFDSPAHLFHMEDKITDALLGNRYKTKEPEKTTATIGAEVSKGVINSNIPAFKGLDLHHVEEREPDVHDAKARGIRNNNPGNIKKTADKWKGEVDGDDTVFKTFKTPEEGINAMSGLLKKYAKRGINTINTLVRRWSSTDQNQYIAYVSKKLGINPNKTINLNDKNTRAMLVNAMIEFENGTNPYGEDKVTRNV